MRTGSIELNEAHWGQDGVCTMPFPDIYFINTHQDAGYAIAQEYSGKVLSAKALSFGRAQDGLLCFTSGDTLCVAEYELLQYRLKYSHDDNERVYLQREIDACQQFGQIEVPQYFGEYPPPCRTPRGITESFIRICNGIYFASAAGQRMFCACYPIWNSKLTIPAQAFGQEAQDYLFYDDVTCAIPMFELMSHYKEVKEAVQSENALYNVLWKHFLSYVLVYNEGETKDAYKVPAPNEDYSAYDFLSITKKQ